MYRFYIQGITNEYHFAELSREFLSEEEFEVIPGNWIHPESYALGEGSRMINVSGSTDTDAIKRELYRALSERTGVSPSWGTLTGVRPLKLARSLFERFGSLSETAGAMKERYLIREDKWNLLSDILTYQKEHVPAPSEGRYAIYIGIPFCPTRCSYCSFAATTAPEGEIAAYFELLLREIRCAGPIGRTLGTPESIYIGGGTPTTLSDRQLEELFRTLYASFDIDPADLEITVEAGRPDTITRERLHVIRSFGIERISINPQSMKEETLHAIGRSHTPEDIRAAFQLAADHGFRIINSDLIAGLPGEDEADFVRSLEEILSLGANNITVHTLSVKRGSRLREQDPGYYRRNIDTVSRMLEASRSILSEGAFRPYYIYRQKHQIGSFENVGYAKAGLHSLYNIRIMEEKQTILGLGAGAIGKVYFPEEDRLERVANVGNYRVYIDRFEEMLERKKKYLGGKHGN